jgi:ABC-type branched-subunit amino acid transport system permease subunit
MLAFAATNPIAILGLNLIAGQAGLMSLGHGAFYGLGAYTLAVLMRHWSVSAYAAIFAAGLVRLVTGYVFRTCRDAARRLLPRPHDLFEWDHWEVFWMDSKTVQ